jgi:hypothetical protein
MLHSFRRIAAIVIALATLEGATISPQASASPATEAALKNLPEVMVPTLAGFSSERTSLSGGPTGRIGFIEATSSDCAVSSTSKREWMGSELKYFDHSVKYPETYLLDCVTLMTTSAAAVAEVRSYTASPYIKAEVKAFTSIPDAAFVQVGPATQIVFAKGQYFVFTVGTDAATGNAIALAKDLAMSQYRRILR